MLMYGECRFVIHNLFALLYFSLTLFCCLILCLHNCVLDEVGAVVVDIGSSSFRGGYAGEDMPKVLYFII